MAIDPVELEGLRVVTITIAVLAVVVALLWMPLRYLPRRMRLWLTIAALVVSWAFEANTANFVLTRSGHCETMPIWPPFVGTPVHAPQAIMGIVALLAAVSVPLVVMSFVSLRRHNWR